jgi:uncharacterized phage protein (TIGR01671 family)
MGCELMNGSTSRTLWEDESNYILQQWTGLLDRNGKEIYEGDVLRRHWDDGTYTDGEIIFADAAFLWKEIGKHAIGINTIHSEVIGSALELEQERGQKVIA